MIYALPTLPRPTLADASLQQCQEVHGELFLITSGECVVNSVILAIYMNCMVIQGNQ